jgi:hypothetical protein
MAARLTLGLALLPLCACNTDPIGRTVPVKGKVLINNKALSGGSVAFWPNKDKGNNSAFEAGGQIGPDGTYEIFTRGKPGVPPGHYKVTVVSQAETDSLKPTKAKLLVPEACTDPKTTPFLIEVIDEPKTYDLIYAGQ